jgi:uncharacterized protein YdaU (DUF1376 family)
LNGLPYYKAFPRDFIDGTVGMDLETKGAYRIVLDLIYMHGGALPDDPRYISGQLGCSIRKWNAIRLTLIERRKLRTDGDHLANERADKELETLGKFQDKQRENRARPNKIKVLQSPRFNHTDTDTDREDTEANASDAKSVLWTRGVTYLCNHGSTAKNARSFIGKCLKDADAETVRNVFRAAVEANTHDPIPYITAALKPKSAPQDAVWDDIMQEKSA